MRILHVNGHLAQGGLEVYLHDVARRLDALGHEQALLHGRPAPSGHAAPRFPGAAHLVPGVTDIGCPGLGARLAEAREVLRGFRPDVVLLHKVMQHALVRELVGHGPAARFVHDVQPVCPEGRKTLNRRTPSGGPELCPYALGWACQARAYVHRCMPRDPRIGLPLIAHLRANLALHRERTPMACPSEFIRSLLLQNGFAPERVTVLPHFTQAPPPDAAAGPAAGAPTALYAGRVHAGKGLGVLLRAMAQLPPETRLDVAGDGPDLEMVKNLSRELGLGGRVAFHGWLDREALDALYARCTVAVVPTLCRESFCMAGIEAMAHAKPVVGTDMGGVPEWLEHGVTGLLVPAGDAAALAAALGRIFSSTEIASEMGRQGRGRVESRFTPQRHVQGLVRLLERTVRGD